MKQARWTASVLVFLLAARALVLVPPLEAQVSTETVFPGESWEYVAKEDLRAYGWSPEALDEATAFIRDESNTTGLVVVDRGRIVYRFGDIEELSYVASVRKSILAVLYGFWVENGIIDLETTLSDLGFDDIGGLLPIEKEATIHHLITARSGVYHPASYSGDDLEKAPPRGSQKPGAYMLYSNWDFNAAGTLFEHLTKRDIYDELQAQLATPLSFEDWERSVQQKAGDLTISKYPAYPIVISTRDMARIGYLMLHEGNWNGRQVISRDWARRITSVVTPVEEMNPLERRDGYFGYGYMWWIWDGPKAIGPFEGAYTARGAVGQWIAVFPSLQLVLAHKTHNVYRRSTSWESFERIIELLFEAKGVAMPGPFPWAETAGSRSRSIAKMASVVNSLWSVSASWSDLDGDGNVDLYVANYVNFGLDNNPDCSRRMGGRVLRSYCLPDAFGGLPDALYRNRGDGTFEDVSRRAGVALDHGKGLGVVAFDYDRDGLTDLYVANDTTPNFLFRNLGGMRFRELALESGVAYDGDGNAQAGMGVDAGDYDRDGDMDLFVTNFQGEFNTLYRSGDKGFFTDVSSLAGLGRPSLRSLGFGTAFVDLDNDGWLDVVVANGHVLDNTAEFTEGSSYPQPNQLFQNRGDGSFQEIRSAGPGFDQSKVNRGLAFADVEGDGDLDLLFTTSGGRPDLLGNDGHVGNSLRMLLVGRLANRDAVGALLTLDVGGERRITTEVRAGSSYASQNERIVHAGLGTRTRVQNLTIRWPGSGKEVLGPLEAGELIVVVEGR